MGIPHMHETIDYQKLIEMQARQVQESLPDFKHQGKVMVNRTQTPKVRRVGKK